MNKIFFSSLLAAVCACAPLVYAQGAKNNAQPEAVSEAKTGVSFVICSPAGKQLPSPLYVLQGKSSKAVYLNNRTPGPRLRPTNGSIVFYEQDPVAALSATGDKKGGAKPAAADAAAAKALPEPYLTVSVPAGATKAIGLLVPGDKPNDCKCLFIDERQFPKKGVHLINLSPYPLQITTSAAGDFSDKKVSNIAPYKKEDGVGGKNSWSFTKAEDGDYISFVLGYKDKNSKEFKRLKASRFVVSSKQSQINLIVKDPAQERAKIIVLQNNND